MGIKAALSKPYAKFYIKRVKKAQQNAVEEQKKLFKSLLSTAANTAFGKDHDFNSIQNHADFVKRVPIRDYEGLKSYVDRIVAGEEDILWPGKPIYLSKTSGTTSGAKFIPITKESMPNHIDSAKAALLSYIYETGDASFVDGKMIFLQGSPELHDKNGIPLGRLSGIVAHHVPGYLLKNRLPSFETNCIEDWETKLDAVIDETLPEKMTLISGIPSWVQMYFERILERTGKKNIAEVFPDFSLFVYGGVNFEPYRKHFDKLIGKKIPSVETYPASEGFIAYQDSQKEKGLALVVNNGIFYEFVPTDEVFDENPTRLTLEEVELDKNYAIILNTNAGLWGYNIGDTVKFVSKDPYRIVVTGRIKHFISAFGEHVIAEEVEKTMQEACQKFDAEVVEFTVAPMVRAKGESSYHEWFVEFSKEPLNLEEMTIFMDKRMQGLNIYYKDLLEGNILRPLKISKVKRDGFVEYMKSQGKLGGQNKIPRLSNDRKIADNLPLV